MSLLLSVGQYYAPSASPALGRGEKVCPPRMALSATIYTSHAPSVSSPPTLMTTGHLNSTLLSSLERVLRTVRPTTLRKALQGCSLDCFNIDGQDIGLFSGGLASRWKRNDLRELYAFPRLGIRTLDTTRVDSARRPLMCLNPSAPQPRCYVAALNIRFQIFASQYDDPVFSA